MVTFFNNSGEEKGEKSSPALTVLEVKKIDKLSYLNGFSIKYTDKKGKKRLWELASRGGEERLKKEIFGGETFSDGAMIFATDESKSRVVILKEYRVSAGRYVYMFPAGLVDGAESIEQAAVREFREETGLTLLPQYIEKSRYVSVGITNEKSSIVYGIFSGEPNSKFQSENEDAQIVIIDKIEAQKILKEGEVSIRTALLLENFFNINPFFSKFKNK